jgi:hypothetical protein
MTKAIAILKIQGGVPVSVITGPLGTPVEPGTILLQGYNLLHQHGDIGLYLVSGTPAELQSLDAATTICAGGTILNWPGVKHAIPAATLARINSWLVARNQAQLPAGITWTALFKQLRMDFDATTYDLGDDDPVVQLPRIQTIFVAPQMVQLTVPIEGPCYKLLDVGAYTLWQVDTNAANALALHNVLYAMTPASTLGALAVVKEFGATFEDSAIRTATKMTAAQATARRNRVATYLDSLGKNTVALRDATTEHAQVLGIVSALGYSAAQMWSVMANDNNVVAATIKEQKGGISEQL